MHMIKFVAPFAMATLCLVACGPMQMPLPTRLEPEEQMKIDAAWAEAFDPIERLDNQSLLDVLLTSQGYQLGVDRFTFRSEKSCAAGLVAMESRFDRAHPEMDIFIVTLYDHAGRIARHETYGREQMHSAYKELFIEFPELERKKQSGSLSPDEAIRLAELRRRTDICDEILPDFNESASAP